MNKHRSVDSKRTTWKLKANVFALQPASAGEQEQFIEKFSVKTNMQIIFYCCMKRKSKAVLYGKSKWDWQLFSWQQEDSARKNHLYYKQRKADIRHGLSWNQIQTESCSYRKADVSLFLYNSWLRTTHNLAANYRWVNGINFPGHQVQFSTRKAWRYWCHVITSRWCTGWSLSMSKCYLLVRILLGEYKKRTGLVLFYRKYSSFGKAYFQIILLPAEGQNSSSKTMRFDSCQDVRDHWHERYPLLGGPPLSGLSIIPYQQS